VDKEILKKRFFDWVMQILDFVLLLPEGPIKKVIAHQLIKSSTSSGANYRAACRAKSIADMINKFKIVEEELDESIYWLEIIDNKYSFLNPKIELREANELLSIIVASIKTLRNRKS